MKKYALIITSTILLAFGLGQFGLSLLVSARPTEEDKRNIEELKQYFIDNAKTIATINLQSIYYSESQYELIDPILNIKSRRSRFQSQVEDPRGLKCTSKRLSPLSYTVFSKENVWEDYLCGRKKFLPSKFFEVPPYLHSSGRSYAFLAFKSNSAEFKSDYWFLENLRFFHLEELSQNLHLLKKFKGNLKYLAVIGPSGVRSMAKGESPLLTKDYFVTLNFGKKGNFGLEFNLHERRELEYFLERTPFKIRAYTPGRPCFLVDGGICWEKELGAFIKGINRPALFFLGLLTLGLGLLLRHLFVIIKGDSVEREQKRLALRVLTHEFRTPVTSLIILVEGLMEKLEDLTPDDQVTILRMNREIYRMQRLTELSNHYLSLEDKTKIISGKVEKLESINEFLLNLAEDYEGIQVKTLAVDQSFSTNIFWLHLCVKNLVENAFRHGIPPIELGLKRMGNYLVIYVKDCGEIETELKNITKAFSKGKLSEGVGLGLNIVSRVVSDLGGELKLEKKPTCFSIWLKEK
ncbi:MAG: HAMP domain-containing histidine kinase [Bacteriovoracaceae bacterium]|jgi:signal transduction histidine kinase|nr:HAMP domain-containing histidine kinase [Bacteriovoracaceae bacterium]